MRVPGSREVDRAIRNVSRDVKGCLKEINKSAARLLARGNYEGAEVLVAKGKQVSAFQQEVEALRRKWGLVKSGIEGGREKPKTTPLWSYYRPILKALVELGGTAAVQQIEEAVEPYLAELLQPGDRDLTTRGKPKWQQMVRRARRAMVKEGMLKDGTALRWVITASGRRAAESEDS